MNARPGQWIGFVMVTVMSAGGVQRGCRREKYWPPTGVIGNSGKDRGGRSTPGELGFSSNGGRVEQK